MRALLRAQKGFQSADAPELAWRPGPPARARQPTSSLGPKEPAYKDVESSVVRYDYDPRRAAQLVEGLQYTKGMGRSVRCS